MGGLFNKMPITSLVATFATLSIIAVPYFAGYYSKEGILLASYAKAQVGGVYFDKIIFWIIMGAALLTPVYMGRLFFNVFMGKISCTHNLLLCRLSAVAFLTKHLAVLCYGATAF